MRYQQSRLPKKRKYRKRSDWTLNEWLEKVWGDGLRRPLEEPLAALSPGGEVPVTRPIALTPLSAKAVKALIYMKGWLLKDVAAHWCMCPESLSRIIRAEHRSPMFDEAVLGLPMRGNRAFVLHPEVRNLLVELVAGRNDSGFNFPHFDGAPIKDGSNDQA
jgi:hypothetical protein